MLRTDLRWKILVLIPKVNVDTWGVSFLEVLCKVVEDIIGTRVKTTVKFHDILHGFRANRGIWVVIVDLTMAQDMASIDYYTLFLVFQYLSKAYNNLNGRSLLETLGRYGAGFGVVFHNRLGHMVSRILVMLYTDAIIIGSSDL